MSERVDKIALLRPLAPPRSRTSGIIERLSADITAGKLQPGARLPTEQAMMAALGVSRTVVREAVAALRAEGLVETRQGVGAFVVRDVQRRPFRIDPTELATLDDVLRVMELRTGIEIEAAGIAAERVTAAGRQKIARALKALEAAIKRGEAAVDEDFAFHQAIAEATANPHFTRFLEFLGRFLIPRQSVRTGLKRPEDLRAYLARIQNEHRQIHDAVAAGEPDAARRAMRQHLMNAQKRYRRLAAAQQPARPAEEEKA